MTAPPPSREPVQLAWVLAGRRLRHVSTFARLAVGDRPPVRCPVCREAVTLKLGGARAHHAAHQHGSRCPLDGEETALHYNTKQHLASALRAAAADASALVVRLRCGHRYGVAGETVLAPGQVPCEALRDVVLVAGWDAVDVEVGLSAIRPDILLRAGGRPVAILEVRRTHAVTAEKLERLAALGVPWAEVTASRRLYDALAGWTADAPLPVTRTDAVAQWRCPSHAGVAHRRRAGARGRGPWIARVVDRYTAAGRVERDVVYVAGLVRGARVSEPLLMRRSSDEPLATLPNGDAGRVRRAAHDALVAWAATLHAGGERVDSPMAWAPAASLRSDDDWVAATTLYPHRFRFDRATGRWVRRAGVGEHRWLLARPLPDPSRARR